jgi:hypothetical protein
MPYEETGKEKQKREDYYKANKERGVRQEAERDYKMFGTTEQNIPAVDTMGNVTGMKKGGKVKRFNGEEGSEVFSKAEPYLKKAVEKMDKSLGVTKETSPELQKSFAEKLARISGGSKGSGGSGVGNGADIKMLQNPKAMKKGGSVKASKMGSVKSSPRRDGIAQRGHTKGRVC